MALLYDVTKAASARELSGLIRVSEKLRHALENSLGEELILVEWNQRRRCLRFAGSRDRRMALSPDHHFLTPEVFSCDNRPGLYELLKDSGVKSAAIFHDAIPLKYPDITWPKSVERHSQYMCDLAGLDQVFSVSRASQNDLEDYWAEQGISRRPQLSTITLGANFFDSSEIDWEHQQDATPVLLNVGILEPRKNQAELLDVVCRLWAAGHDFELHFFGRINPHFGKPIAKKIKQAGKSGYAVHLHSKQSDQTLLDLYSRAHFTVFNSITEGFGLPVVESLWLGIPCITRRLPSLLEFIDGQSCRGTDSVEELETAISEWLVDPEALTAATFAAQSRDLPTWDDTVKPILEWKESH